MSRFARHGRVFYFEEPVFEDGPPHLRHVECEQSAVRVLTPVLPHGLSSSEVTEQQELLLHAALREYHVDDFVAWYYTPMALEFSRDLEPLATIYDCMDELSGFAGAPAAMRANELALFRDAQLVFTGGASLYESKRLQHPAVHLFPSSVDVAHFACARTIVEQPSDQAHIPCPRLGYSGVIDERMDLELLRYLATARPHWQFVMLGPVVKIDPANLPCAPNIHYLGMKPYSELPAYLSGWDIALLPFALNDATRFISPTKTPEYLAAGLPVISTNIRDVATPYGELGLVAVAHNPSEFLSRAESAIRSPLGSEALARIDRFLSRSSWDKTFNGMDKLMIEILKGEESACVTAMPASKGMAHV